MSRRSTSGAEAAQTHPQRRGPMVVSCPRSASPRRQLRSGACTPYRTGANSTTDMLYLGNVGRSGEGPSMWAATKLYDHFDGSLYAR